MESRREIKLRRSIFWPALLVWVWVSVTNLINNWVDPCLLGYAFGSMGCKWMFGLSVAHWWSRGEAKTVFKWLVALVAGLSINYDFQWYARNMRVNGFMDDYNQFVSSPLWHYRDALVIISLIYLMAVISSRMILPEEKK